MENDTGNTETANVNDNKYGTQTGRPNPVQLAFQQELSRFVKYVTRKAELGPKWKKPDEESYARGSNTLFNLWNNYESRLQQNYFVQKLISTGDFLHRIKEYKIAQYQCYGRYLSTIRPPKTTIESCADSNAENLKSIYFSKGLTDPYATTVLRALLGESICSFHVTIADDIKLKNSATVTRSVAVLKMLRMITQIALHKETFCWLVFNGTVHIYTICRHLMGLGHSKMVVEFLLWACTCMESSVPLMTVRYLSWRCTLYAAVCQCFYDLKALPQAESFAKRAVTKVNELEDIERISTSETTSMSVGIFREAKAKMQVMVFKRVVFETRKRPKGLLRPKTKPNLKDTVHLPWPRTPAERLLADLFQANTSAQFLAILEALSNSHHRTLHCEPPPVDTEDSMTDVYGELFFAGLEIIAGGGGMKHQHAMKHEDDVHPSVLQLADATLIELIRDGIHGVPLHAVVKFVKCAFNYEQWDTFNFLVYQTIELLQTQQTSTSLIDIKTLEIMLALEHFYNIKKPKKAASQSAVDESSEQHANQGKNSSLADDLMPLADILHSCSVEPFKCIIGHMDPDMVIDTALFLWSKCKTQFQRVVSGSMESCKFVLNDKDYNKWIYLTTVVHTALSWSDACTFDPILFAEVALKLSLVLECKAGQNEGRTECQPIQDLHPESKHESVQGDKQDPQKQVSVEVPEKQAERNQTSCSNSTKYSSVLGLSDEGYSHGVKGLLSKSCDILYQAFEGVSRARDAKMQTNSKDIVDVTVMKGAAGENSEEAMSMVDNVIKALHMELLFVHHRVSVKLAELDQDQGTTKSQKIKPKLDRPKGSATSLKEDTNDMMPSCGKNPLSKALLLMHKAGCLASSKGITGTEQQTQLMKESIELIHKAQNQEEKLLKWNKESVVVSDIPPPPILLHRSRTMMVFKPAPFEPKNDKVVWYSLFARSASGNNIKVRLNDYQLIGTGEETPATDDCIFTVRGLIANQRYVFAVAAYNAKGQLIGKSIGNTSRPILATHSLPTLMAWGYLAQIAYASCVPSIAQQACAVLWNHFVIEPQPSEEELKIEKADNDFEVRVKLLDEEKVHSSPPVLVRQFLQSIFISVDLSIKENFLYCNSLCDNGPLYNSQISRLHECERLLLAMKVAGWLNDTPMCLQAIVQVYGLLAPMIHQKISAKPVIQVLLNCHAVLQEVPSLTRHRRQTSTSDSLSHMIATMTYFVAKTLQGWGELNLCGAIVELGKKMLNLETAPDSAGTMASMQQAAAIATANIVGQPPPKTKKKPKPKHRGIRGKGMDKDLNNLPDGHDEELKMLETYMMKLSQKALNRDDEELTGSEDPIILHSYVSTLPASEAYKEVLKFKRRTRFLEFFVQVLGKAIDEGQIETCLAWANDAMMWIIRRNEMLLANKPTIVRIGTTGVGQEDEKIKRFATAIVEFGKSTTKPQTTRHGETKEVEPDEVRMRTKQETAKPPQTKNIKSSIMSRKTGKTKGRTEEEVNLHLAIEKLQAVLPDYWRSCNRRKKLRSVNKEELPWKVQLNILTAGCNLDLFLERLGTLQRFTEDGDNPMHGPFFMDPDWFSFSTSATLITSWAGGSRHDPHEPPVGLSGSVMESPPYASPAVTTGHSMRTQQRLTQPPPETARAGSRITAVSEKDTDSAPKSPLVYLGNVFSNITRAIVLSHRGKYWTMMQNACRLLCNATDTILMRIMSGSLRLTDDPLGESRADIDILRGALWKPFYTAADCLMDMIVNLQEDIKIDAQINQKYDKVKKGDPEINEVSGLMGGVEDQKGGSSLRFEIPLDNNSILDTRWFKRLVLYAAEMMFYETKWERVVDVILRFNALTRSRYAESVLPMLIVAQRQLAERIEENGGLSKSQPVITVSKETGVAEEFIIIPDEYERIEPGVHLDPIGHDVYSGSTVALRLISVPLDINESLSTLRQALDIKHHTARALEHSRQLLLCYLAGQHKGGSSHKLIRRGSSRVGFVPSQIKPPSDVPLDLSEETFESIEDIRSYILQPSQLAVVVSSYDKTIEMLQFRQQRGLAAQAMHELGNIMFHSGNIRTAFKWWAEALDTVLNTHDALKTWRDIANEDDLSQSAVLLKRCGLWGCLLAAILAANIAQYVYTTNLGLRQECCLLSSTLFKALLCSSLPHPTADKDYALYEIGAGYKVKELIPGVDLLSDVFRSDGRSVVAALRWVTEELVRARHLLAVLPLISLCLYFTNHVCRDVQRTAEVRLLRVRVLTDLGLFSEAITVLWWLLHGHHLPRSSMDGHVNDSNKKPPMEFSNAKPLTDNANIEVVNELLEHTLPVNLVSLYGEYISSRVHLAHAHLLIAIATKVCSVPENMIDEIESFFAEKAEAEAAEAERELTPAVSSKVLSISTKIGKAKKSAEELLSEVVPTFNRKLITADTSPETLKGLLLCQAERILKQIDNTISQQLAVEDLEEGEEVSYNLSPCYLELLVYLRVELSQISLERHKAVTSGMIVYSAMRAMEDAAVLSELEAEKRSPSMFNTSPLRSISPSPLWDHYLTLQSRERLDARLWLTCRLALTKSLLQEDSGMGKLGGLARSITAQIGSCEHHCRQGLDEAEAFGDVEIAAEFGMVDFVHSLQSGKISDELVSKLEDVILRLEQCQTLSYAGQYLLAQAVMQYGDINKQGNYSNELSHIREPQVAYQQAVSVLLKQMVNLGECVDRTIKAPVLPLKNIYLYQIGELVDLKLRMGRVLARGSLDHNGNKSQNLSDSVKELELGLSLLRNAAFQRAQTEAQLLLSLGQVQRQLFNDGIVSGHIVIDTFIDAIKQSFSSEHDLSAMKQAYLEMAVIFLANVKQAKEADELLTAAEPQVIEQQKPAKSDKKENKTKPKGKSKESKERLKEIDREKKSAWLAIRSASLISMAHHQIGLMTGDPEISILQISQKSGKLVPDFALIELLGTDDVIASQDGSLVGAKGVVAMGTAVNETDVVRITWNHFLGYLSLLRRQRSYKALGINPVDESGMGSMGLALSPLFSDNKAQKLSAIHNFLRSELEPYGLNCCGVFPAEGLSLPSNVVITHPTKLDVNPRSSKAKAKGMVNGFSPANAKEFELSVYWGKLNTDLTSQDELTVFIYALNSKTYTVPSNVGASSLKTGLCYVSLARVQALHEALMSTLELAENELQPSPSAKVSKSDLSIPDSKTPTGGRKKRTMGIRALSAKQKRDDTIRSRLKEHILEISDMLQAPKDTIPQDVPFDVTLKNVACLEAIFDPSRGFTTRATEAFFSWFSSVVQGY